jgi:hypothetical protein
MWMLEYDDEQDLQSRRKEKREKKFKDLVRFIPTRAVNIGLQGQYNSLG